MGKNVVQKVLEPHIVEGKWETGKEIGIHIDQTLTQDATGTMAYLQFEAMGVPRVKTELSVSYVDHNTVQIGYETLMTTATYKALPPSMASSIPALATGFVIRFI